MHQQYTKHKIVKNNLNQENEDAAGGTDNVKNNFKDDINDRFDRFDIKVIYKLYIV